MIDNNESSVIEPGILKDFMPPDVTLEQLLTSSAVPPNASATKKASPPPFVMRYEPTPLGLIGTDLLGGISFSLLADLAYFSAEAATFTGFLAASLYCILGFSVLVALFYVNARFFSLFGM